MEYKIYPKNGKAGVVEATSSKSALEKYAFGLFPEQFKGRCVVIGSTRREYEVWLIGRTLLECAEVTQKQNPVDCSIIRADDVDWIIGGSAWTCSTLNGGVYTFISKVYRGLIFQVTKEIVNAAMSDVLVEGQEVELEVPWTLQ